MLLRVGWGACGLPCWGGFCWVRWGPRGFGFGCGLVAGAAPEGAAQSVPSNASEGLQGFSPKAVFPL